MKSLVLLLAGLFAPMLLAQEDPDIFCLSQTDYGNYFLDIWLVPERSDRLLVDAEVLRFSEEAPLENFSDRGVAIQDFNASSDPELASYYKYNSALQPHISYFLPHNFRTASEFQAMIMMTERGLSERQGVNCRSDHPPAVPTKVSADLF